MESPLKLPSILLFLFYIACHAESDFSVTENAQEQRQHGQQDQRDDKSILLFTHAVYRASVREHFPFTNESIRQSIPVVPPIRVQQTFESDANVRYSILSGDDDGYFRMDALSGELMLTRQVDRERLPISTAGDRFSLVVQASVAADVQPARARLLIDIEDINDNSPVFEQKEYVISIVENLPVGFNVLQLSANDADLGENGRFTYRLIDASRAFRIDPLTGWLSVTNSTPLDRERVNRLLLEVEAVEEVPNVVTAAAPVRSSARIDIELTDANDNSPIFQPTNLYSFTVEADAGTGTVVGQVRAVDADADDNGSVIYVIQHQQESVRTSRAGKTSQRGGGRPSNLSAIRADGDVPFSIHPRSGHLIVTDVPLTMKSYTLIVEASDEPANPSERRHSLAVVQISVLPPTPATPKFVNLPYEFWVGESAPVDTSVGQVRTEGFLEHEDVRFAIRHQHRKSVPFGIDSRTGIIRVTAGLRASTTFTLNVTAAGGLQEPINTNLTIRVVSQLTGRSATSPSTSRDLPAHRFTVVENSPAGPVGQITYGSKATAGAKLDFLPLDQKDAAWEHFQLARNGTLYTARPLDRESLLSNFTLIVAVSDDNGIRDTLRVAVAVADLNDNPPVFSHKRYVGRVHENVPAGTRIRLGQPIKATDADAWPHNITRYSLAGTGSRLFRIDPAVGEVFVVRSRSLDRERTPFYNFTILASDGSLASEAQLTIIIEDVNDNAPKVAGFVPTVGVVALERSADREEFADEGVIIICADGSCSAPIDLDEQLPQDLPPGRMLATYSRFRNHLLRILDDWIDEAERSVDPIPPDENEILERAFREILYNSSILIQVPDDLPVNNSVGAFSVEDGDKGDPAAKSSQFRFALAEGTLDDDYFQLDTETGSLFIKKPLQPDKVYTIVVQVSDQIGLHSETNISVQLTDTNRHRPAFDRSFYELVLPEGEYRRSAFVAIEATDKDSGDNGRLSYSLVESTPTPFLINEKTGLLMVNGSVDRERTEFYRLTVQVSDGGFPPLKARAEVVVYITDVNDNAPQFELPAGRDTDNGLQPLFTVSLTDGTPPGTAVIRVRATDADADAQTNANVTYQLGSHQQLFTIDEVTGSIFTLVALNRTRGDREYNLLVMAIDGGTPRLSTVGVVRITVAQACDADVAARRQQSITLDENIPTPIALVNLTSDERKSEDMVHLSLLRIEPSWPAAQALFRLDPSEPVLWLMEPLDREILDTYAVHLRVQKPHPRRQDASNTNSTCSTLEEEELVLNIRVADVNDNPPVFADSSPLVAVVPSGSYVGYPVVTLSVTDADDGNNAVVKYSIEPELVTNDTQQRVDWAAALSINSSSGLVSLAMPVDHFSGHILPYTIKATDRSGSGLSSSLRLSMHVVDRSHQVVLVLATGTEDMVSQSANISRIVSDVLGLQVWVRSVEPHVDGDTVDGTMTDVVLYGRNHTDLLIGSDILARLLNEKRDELGGKLYHYQLTDVHQTSRNAKTLPALSDQKIDALEVTLITMGAAVLLGAMAAVVCIVLSRIKHKKRTRLVSSTPLSMTMDYHLQSLKDLATSTSYNDSSQAALMSTSSSGSSETYGEVPVDKGHSLYVSALPPTDHQTKRCQQSIPIPMCSSCKRRKTKRCKCGGKRSSSEIAGSFIGSDSWLLRRKSDPFCRLHSLPLSSRTLHLHSSSRKERSNNAKLVRVSVAQRSSMRAEPAVLAAVHFQDEKRCSTSRKTNNKETKRPRHRCQQHGRRRGSPSLVQVHRRDESPSQPSNRHREISVGSSSM